MFGIVSVYCQSKSAQMYAEIDECFIHLFCSRCHETVRLKGKPLTSSSKNNVVNGQMIVKKCYFIILHYLVVNNSLRTVFENFE